MLLSIVPSLTLAAQACPVGMQYKGNGCSPPCERSMDNWLRERSDRLDSLGPKRRAPVRSWSLDELKNRKRLQADKDQRHLSIGREFVRGVWLRDDEPTQEVQVFGYRHEIPIGTVAFAVLRLAAALDGMRNKQRLKLAADGQPGNVDTVDRSGSGCLAAQGVCKADAAVAA